MKWKPIDTAPHDGRELVVGWDSASVWIVRGARWTTMDRTRPDCLGWWSYRHSVTQEMIHPTHWLCEVGDEPCREEDG